MPFAPSLSQATWWWFSLKSRSPSPRFSTLQRKAWRSPDASTKQGWELNERAKKGKSGGFQKYVQPQMSKSAFKLRRIYDHTVLCFVSISRELGEEFPSYTTLLASSSSNEGSTTFNTTHQSVAAPSRCDSKALISAFVIFPAIARAGLQHCNGSKWSSQFYYYTSAEILLGKQEKSVPLAGKWELVIPAVGIEPAMENWQWVGRSIQSNGFETRLSKQKAEKQHVYMLYIYIY